MTASSPALRRLAPVAPSAPTARARLRILLADDEDGLRASLCRLLERLGHEVTAVANGEAALSLFGLRPSGFDLALLDVDMPHDGLRTLRALRSVAPRLPIILMSANALDASLPAGLAPNAFIRKPFPLPSLLDVLADVTPTSLPT